MRNVEKGLGELKEIMVRIANENDLENILDLYLDLHEDSVPADDEKRRIVWESILNDKKYNLIVNEVDGVIVSSCTCIIIPNLTRNLSPYALIENVVTERECEGHGYARACLEYAKQIALNNDCYKIMLMTGSHDERTHEFYRSCGYKSDGKTAYVNMLREVKFKH